MIHILIIKDRLLPTYYQKTSKKTFPDNSLLVSGNSNEIKWLSSLINVLITNQAEVIDES